MYLLFKIVNNGSWQIQRHLIPKGVNRPPLKPLDPLELSDAVREAGFESTSAFIQALYDNVMANDGFFPVARIVESVLENANIANARDMINQFEGFSMEISIALNLLITKNGKDAQIKIKSWANKQQQNQEDNNLLLNYAISRYNSLKRERLEQTINSNNIMKFEQLLESKGYSLETLSESLIPILLEISLQNIHSFKPYLTTGDTVTCYYRWTTAVNDFSEYRAQLSGWLSAKGLRIREL